MSSSDVCVPAAGAPAAVESWTTPRVGTDLRVDRGMTGFACRVGTALGRARQIRPEDVKDGLRRTIKRYPAQVLITAWALGMFAGRALRKR